MPSVLFSVERYICVLGLVVSIHEPGSDKCQENSEQDHSSYYLKHYRSSSKSHQDELSCNILERSVAVAEENCISAIGKVLP